MRLIFVTDTLSSGGAERAISVLANSFSEKHQTEVVCLRKMQIFYDIHPKVHVVFADDYGKGWLGKMKWLRSYVRGDDVILPFMVKVYCVTLLALVGKKVNIIASERNDPRSTGQPWKLLRRLLLTKVKLLVVQTQQIKNYFPESIRKKTKIIMNPLDLSNCYQGEWLEKSRIVIAVGRIDSQKNYPLMVRAFARLHTLHPDFHLEIWGNRYKESEEALQKQIDELDGTEYIRIYGRTGDVASLYGRAYMFVMSSDYEGLSNALIEALCSGIPVVSTKVSGATDIIKNEENGLLVNIGDEDGLFDAMNRLINAPMEAKRLANNARQSRLLFAKDKICKQWESLISNVLSGENAN